MYTMSPPMYHDWQERKLDEEGQLIPGTDEVYILLLNRKQ